jgi:hypothetical protein
VSVPFVKDRLEEEARRRGGPAGRLPRAGGEEPGDALRAEAPRSDLYERSDEAPDHPPEEVRRGDPEEDQVGSGWRRLHARPRDLDGGRVVAVGVLAEAPEIVAAREARRGLAHPHRVQRVPDPPDERLAEGGSPPRDPVAIDPEERIVARVKPGRRGGELEKVDVVRKSVVDLAGPSRKLPGPERSRKVERGHLGESVDAGVGPPRAVDPDPRAEGLPNGEREGARHRPRIDLSLPSPVSSAVELQRRPKDPRVSHSAILARDMADPERRDAPFTLSESAEAEAGARETLDALLSAAADAAGEAFLGAALGGALGAGEGAVERGSDGRLASAGGFELLLVLDTPLRSAASIGRRVRRTVGAAARARRADVAVDVVARSEIPFLPSTLRVLELLGSGRVVAGPAGLLAGAPDPRRAVPAPREGLRLLVRQGSELLRAEAIADRAPHGRLSREALRIVEETDLALGAVSLLSAGRWVPGLRARDAALRELGLGAAGGAASRGFHTRMSWTRFRDLVGRHREALAARAAGSESSGSADARKAVARAADRWLEVLRLSEEERLETALPDWTELAAVLAGRGASAADGLLFEDISGDAAARRAARRAARAWDPAERLAPAIAALVDWDPGDLPIVPVLLDLPPSATRRELRQRAITWGATA